MVCGSFITHNMFLNERNKTGSIEALFGLYKSKIIEYKGCLLLDTQFDDAIFEDIFSKNGGDIRSTELAFNRIDFRRCGMDYCDSEDFYSAVNVVSKLIKASLSAVFSCHTFIVEVVDFDCQGGWGIEISQFIQGKNSILAQRELLNAEEAASIFCVSTPYIYNLFNIRDVPSVTPQYSQIFFKRADLEEHFKQVYSARKEELEQEGTLIMRQRRFARCAPRAGNV